MVKTVLEHVRSDEKRGSQEELSEGGQADIQDTLQSKRWVRVKLERNVYLYMAKESKNDLETRPASVRPAWFIPSSVRPGSVRPRSFRDVTN